MKNSFGKKLRTAFETRGQLCVGIDPSSEQLLAWGLSNKVSDLERFSFGLLEQLAGRVGIVKPQVAFFEAHGSKGFEVFEKLCLRATEMGLLVIADAKRGDIGSTMDGYGSAWLEQTSPFVVDALTVSSYLGPAALENVVSLALSNGKGIFFLAATSNVEAMQLQSSVSESGRKVAAQVADYVAGKKSSADSSIGLVIGATIDRSLFGLEDDLLRSIPILAPGFGYQGAKLSDLRLKFGSLSKNVICNVSRSVAGDSLSGVGARVEQANRELLEGIQ